METEANPAAQSPTGGSDWSALRPEVLELVLAKLSAVYIIRSKAVCTSWREIVYSYVSSSRYVPQGLPWLLSLYPWTGLGMFFNPENMQTYRIYNQRNCQYNSCSFDVVGSSYGWVVVQDVHSCSQKKCFLLNPLSSERIELPELGKFLLHKAVLSSDPSRDENFRVVGISWQNSELVYYRKGDALWTISEESGYADVIFNDNAFFALSNEYQIQVWKYNGTRNSVPIRLATFTISRYEIMQTRSPDYEPENTWLVKSSGDLFLVRSSYLKEPNREQPRNKFDVYKFDLGCRTLVKKVKSLNNGILFLSRDQATSVPRGQSFPGSRGDTIYYFDHICQRITEFSLKDENEQTIYTFQHYRNFFPLWIVPNPW